MVAARVTGTGKHTVLTGFELRTIFINMDQKRDELLFSSVKGKNPFKDVRVRRAFFQAIDVETIKSRVMRGAASPTAASWWARSGECGPLIIGPS